MKSKKIIMLTAGILLLGGIIIAGAAAAMGGLTKTGPVLQTKSFPSEGVFKIDIDLSFDDIYITTKDTSEIKVTYYTGKTKDYRISTEDGVFTMQTMPASELIILILTSAIPAALLLSCRKIWRLNLTFIQIMATLRRQIYKEPCTPLPTPEILN